MKRLILVSFIVAITLASFSAAYAKTNKLSDIFNVTAVNKGQATVTGTIKNLKAGDYLYFVKPPYEFKVKSIDKDMGQITITLPPGSSLTTSNTLMRYSTPRINRFIQMQERLNQSLDD